MMKYRNKKQKYQHKYYLEKRAFKHLIEAKSSPHLQGYDRTEYYLGTEHYDKEKQEYTYEGQYLNPISRKETTKYITGLKSRNLLLKTHKLLVRHRKNVKNYSDQPTLIKLITRYKKTHPGSQSLGRKVKGEWVEGVWNTVSNKMRKRVKATGREIGELRRQIIKKETGFSMKHLPKWQQNKYKGFTNTNQLLGEGNKMSQQEGYLYKLWLDSKGEVYDEAEHNVDFEAFTYERLDTPNQTFFEMLLMTAGVEGSYKHQKQLKLNRVLKMSYIHKSNMLDALRRKYDKLTFNNPVRENLIRKRYEIAMRTELFRKKDEEISFEKYLGYTTMPTLKHQKPNEYNIKEMKIMGGVLSKQIVRKNRLINSVYGIIKSYNPSSVKAMGKMMKLPLDED